MKASVLFATFSIICLSVFLFWARFNLYFQGVDISINDTNDSYTLTARYDRNETARVERYINQCISPDQMGTSENDYIDANTRLNDNTRFYIKESPGRLKIELDKQANSGASYRRIKQMCEGVKTLLAGK